MLIYIISAGLLLVTLGFGIIQTSSLKRKVNGKFAKAILPEGVETWKQYSNLTQRK